VRERADPGHEHQRLPGAHRRVQIVPEVALPLPVREDPRERGQPSVGELMSDRGRPGASLGIHQEYRQVWAAFKLQL